MEWLLPAFWSNNYRSTNRIVIDRSLSPERFRLPPSNNIKFIWEHFWKVAKTICSYYYEHARHNLHEQLTLKNED
jgi:hypothetical protein